MWDKELPEADGVDLRELDYCPEATEATDCGVDLPEPPDNRDTNPVDVGGDSGGKGINGLGV